MADITIQERLGWEITPKRYRPIRARWITHSIIHFPWDPRHEKFAGERISFDRAALPPAPGS